MVTVGDGPHKSAAARDPRAAEVSGPAGRAVNKMQSRKDKVKDKPRGDPHREYLDAESTDEEERRRKIYEKNIKGFFYRLCPRHSSFSYFLRFYPLRHVCVYIYMYIYIYIPSLSAKPSLPPLYFSYGFPRRFSYSLSSRALAIRSSAVPVCYFSR